MHSRLFQIEKVSNLPLNKANIQEPHQICGKCDWFEDMPVGDEDLKWLESELPQGCFTRDGDVFTLVKPLDEFLENFLDEVKLAFKLITPRTLGGLEWDKALWKAKTNENHFYVYSEYFSCSVPLIRWLMEEVSECKVGETFKVVSIIRYHF